MTIEKRKFALVGALLMAGTGAAQAFTCPPGSTCTPITDPLSVPSSKDTFTFTLPSLSDVSFIGSTSSVDSAAVDTLKKGGVTIPSPAFFSFGSTTTQTFDDLKGTYKYVINGVAGSPGATITLEEVVTSVPEPATYALLFAGLGLVAYKVSRRRSSKSGAVAA